MARRRWYVPRDWRIRLALLVALPLCALNLAVAFFGGSAVFPLSPFFLKEKARALTLYARHRPLCLLRGHADLQPIIARAEKKYRPG